ncbi:hypothetical protein [Pseudoalteromonas sp. T1lg75]|uniref:hypothetical protein n=1 Tax=Pseudoalteromonas sp. T1lg75 TaxID=2077102 RepID=UPI001F21B0E3|nr:hypothetical protein [Pseudoalteromonas sp. T1lg75]
MFFIVALIALALLFCALGTYAFLRASYCACHRQGECDNPVARFWLLAMLSQLLSLGCCALTLHSQQGTLVWVLMTASCLAAAWMSERFNNHAKAKRAYPGGKIRAAGVPLTAEPN